MAVIKHLTSKNANYNDALDYLMYQHDELTGRMIRDDDGHPIPREDFLMDGINCEPFEYPLAAQRLSSQWGKNKKRSEIKSHHYILSFDPRDKQVGLTTDEAHAMALEFAKRHFGAYVGLVFTHPDGNNESGNIHTHIIFCSVRAKDEPVRDWMTQKSEWKAGCKHHPNEEQLKMLKADVMEMCQRRNLHQVDLLSPARERKTEKEHWAEVRLQIKEQAESLNDQSPKKPSAYQTQKQQIRAAVREAQSTATDFDSFAEALNANHNIEAKISRGRINYKHPDRRNNITGRALGLDYEWPVIEASIKHRLAHGHQQQRQGLVNQITDAMEGKGHFYVRKVKSNNIKKLAESLAFIQEAGFEAREELETAVELSAAALAAAEASLKQTEAQLATTNRAIRASGAYLANREVWRQYRASSNRKVFYQQHRRELEACTKARQELKDLFPTGTAPSFNELKAQKQQLTQKRNEAYDRYTTERYRHRELVTVKRNVDTVLGSDNPKPQSKEERS